MNKFIELPEEVKYNHLKEISKVVDSIDNEMLKGLIDWRGELIHQLQIEKSKAWFREQELLGYIELYKKQIK